MLLLWTKKRSLILPSVDVEQKTSSLLSLDYELFEEHGLVVLFLFIISPVCSNSPQVILGIP